MNIQVRMTALWSDISGVAQSLIDLAEKALVFYHPDEKAQRPHYHLYLFGCSRKEDTLRNRVRDYPWPQKEDWCFRNWCGKKSKKEPITEAGAAKYGSKGKYDPFLIKNVSAETIRVGKALGFDKKDKIEAEPVKVNLIKKLTKWDLVGLIHDQIVTHPTYSEHKTYGHMWYMDRIAEVLIEYKQPLGMFKAMDLFEMWKMRYDRTTWVREAAVILDRRYRLD